MVEQQIDSLSEDQADAMTLASSFHAARDADILLVMNAMSNQSPNAEPVEFYIVPSSWFINAYPILSARTPDGITDNWRDHIGRIPNSKLVNVVEREVSSDEESPTQQNGKAKRLSGVSEVQKRRFENMHRRMLRNREQSTMKQGLVHQKDFFFLGPSAWMLVKEKFGFDGYELSRPCVPTGNSRNTLAVKLRATESEGGVSTLIEIPASGRFAYEKVIPSAGVSTRSAIVPEDDDGNNEAPWEAAEMNDDAKSEEDEPVLLLPPSTTVQSNSANSDDMDVETSSDRESPVATAGRKRLASGLGNLGNTCFMNSTLQCLAHTEPLRAYFLSGQYIKDLNRDNPLGTGGELATQFANLMGEMWGVPTKRRNVLGGSDSQYSNSSTGAVYPRNFKLCLGKHAEQFMGYDQHDSQELATYLLDALHEDTNRVTKKPYVEKPEQGEDESDDVAAKKAWSLHLQREDSRVLENFMGQVKSRLECCEEVCPRVSTTFDPFMYLSVPIPGATDRTLKVTFVPLDPNEKMKTVSLTLNKASTMTQLMTKMNEELVNIGILKVAVPLEDLVGADVWSHEIYSRHSNSYEIDRIRDTDHTFIYQLRTLGEVQEESKKTNDEVSEEDIFGPSKRIRKYKLELEMMTKLNKGDVWQNELQRYLRSPTLQYSLFNPNRGTIDEKVQFHKKMETFIDLCHKEIEEDEASGTKRPRVDRESEEDTNQEPRGMPMDDTIQGLVDRSDVSISFKNVRSRNDIAILEFCAAKTKQFILRIIQEKKAEHKEGVCVNVIMRRPQGSVNFSTFVQPLILRIPSNLTVYGFRELLARRIARSLKTKSASDSSRQTMASGESSGESVRINNFATFGESGSFGPPELMILRQVVLEYSRNDVGYSSKSSSNLGKKLGMLTRYMEVAVDGSPHPTIALPTDDDEKKLVAEAVGEEGTIYVDWSQELCDRAFDSEEFDTEEDVNTVKGDIMKKDGEKTTSVLDCIKKYCQMEQLEETEMWYCNRCKDHVRAWKQFHLYRAPPILIVHLKRFHYSASTHRRDKITSLIDFPLEGLDLTGLVSHYEEDEDPIYDCYAVSNHYGGLGGGHYTAYILSDDGTWCHYDDSRVTCNIGTSEVVSEAAYVLYYRRKDVPVGQDLIEEPQTSAFIADLTEPSRENSEISSNNSAQASDDMAVDGDVSSHTCSSPMGSVDGDNEQTGSRKMVSFVPGGASNHDDDLLLQ